MHEPMCAPATAPDLRKDFDNLLDLIRMRAEHHAHKPAYVFLADGEDMEETLGFGHLDLRARAIAAYLQQRMAPGSRVLLLYPAGLDYIAAFLGCLYAGVVAVPAYPPNRHHGQRLHSVVQDAQPAAVSSVSGLAERLQGESADWAGSAQWLLTDAVDEAEARAWRPPELDHASLAFLQYTSGSTGSPKGVMVSHGNLLANQEVIRRAFGHDAESTVVGWLPFYHDMGLIGNVLQPLCVGATAVLMPPLRFLEKPLRWLQAVSRYRAHTSGGPNFAYELCIRKIAEADKAGLDLRHWRVAFNGAEPVRADTLRRFGAAFAGCGFRPEAHFPCYGLAESTLFVTGPAKGQGACFVVPTTDSAKRVGCGSTGDGHAARIVDPASGAPRPEGAEGEIWIAGPSVADGYWNRPAESEHTFRARLPGDERYWLRSGDLGLLHQGQLVVTGRIKDLIIVRGRNFYPHDIEQALDRIDGLRPGCAVAFGTEIDGDEGLVVVAEARRPRLAEGEAQALRDVIRAAVAAVCDAPLAAIALVPPGAVPKTSSGKLQRSECRRRYEAGELPILTSTDSGLAEPAIDLLGAALRALPAEQRAPLLQSWLVDRAAQVLKTNPATVQAAPTLASLGLHSLQALELKHAVDQLLGCDAPLDWFLADLDLVELAARVASAEPVEVATDEDVSDEASWGQKGMWAVQQQAPGDNGYNLHLALRLRGALDLTALRLAFEQTLKRHPELHTVFETEGDVIHRRRLPVADAADFESIDAAGWDTDRLQQDLCASATRPYALDRDPLLRVRLYLQGVEDAVLLLGAHHIAVDLWSLLRFLQDWGAVYKALRHGQTPPELPPPADYGSFVRHQQCYLQSPRAAADAAWWLEQLQGELPLLALPTDDPRNPAAGYAGASHRLRLDAGLTRALQQLAQAQGTTLYGVLLTLYQTLLFRVCGQDDLVVGTAASGRGQGAFAGTVGNFVNPLALRGAPRPGLRFDAYLDQVKTTLRQALAHQHYPFALLVERLNPTRRGDQWPVFQTWFVLQQAQPGIDPAWTRLALGEDGPMLPWAGLEAAPLALRERVENFDLKLMAAEWEDGLELSFQYRKARFAPQTIEQLAASFATLARAVVSHPQTALDALPLMDAQAVYRVLHDWNRTLPVEPPVDALHALFERQARRQPQAPAVRIGETTLRYGELDARAGALASHLRAAGVGADDRVLACLERGPDLLVGLLGILKAGAAYVPVDPGYPPERIAEMRADCGARVVVAQRALAESAGFEGARVLAVDDPALGIPTGAPRRAAIHPEQAAYLIYTSGSTGKPKGVVISHRNAVHSTWARQVHYPRPVRGFLLLSPAAFDSSVAGLFWTLSQGGLIRFPDDPPPHDAAGLAELIRCDKLSHLLCLPSLYRVLLEQAVTAPFPDLAVAIVAGEASPADLPEWHRAVLPECALYNEYGPTEASVWSSAQRLEPDPRGRAVPIGKPVPGMRLYVLDARLEPMPPGVPGELYVAGPQVARGYLGRADLSAERFLPDPFGTAGTRMYRSGDRVRWRHDGVLEFLGRADHQVKVRGHRIELGEIETALARHPAVREAVVLAHADGQGGNRLAAYVVLNTQLPAAVETLCAHLAASLPEYMLPAAWVILDRMPHNANGKLDRNKLPAPEFSIERPAYSAPRNGGEQALAQIWADLLGLAQVGIHDNFFALGGDSIRAIQAASRAHQAGWPHSPRQLFQHQTIAALAAVIEPSGATASDLPSEPFALCRLRETERTGLEYPPDSLEDIYPLTPMQEGMLFATLMAPGSGIYLMQDRFELAGDIDPALFRDAWTALLACHPVLRSSFWWQTEGVPHQLVHRSVELPFESLDWSDLPAAEQDARLEEMLAAERETGFDLTHPPLLRLRLIRTGEGRWRFIRSHHHILLDAWCTSLLLMEFRARYLALATGQPWTAPAPPPFRRYLDWLDRHDAAATESYWRDALRGYEQPTLLVDQNGPQRTVAEEPVADVVERLSAADTADLHALAKRWRVTPNTFVQGAWALLLSRYTDLPEVVFGVTVAGRPVDLPAVEDIIGLFINTLPLRVRLRPRQTVRTFLEELQARNADMRQHEHAPLARLQDWSELPAGADLFDHIVVYENAPIDPSLRNRTGLLDLIDVRVRTHTNFPITVMVIPEEELHLQISYERARVEETAARRMLGHFRQALETMIGWPELELAAIDLLSAEETTRLRAWATGPATPLPTMDLGALLEAQRQATPGAVAVACGAEELSYEVLHRRADRVAHALWQAAIGPDAVVAVIIRRGVGYLAALVGVLKAGAAFLPIDPGYPDGRVAEILGEAKPDALLADAEQFERLRPLAGTAPLLAIGQDDAGGEVSCPPCAARPEHLGYVIYTSGSTGKPKGAMVTRAGLRNNLLSKISTLGLGTSDRIAQTASQSFDISVWQCLAGLLCGARVEVLPDAISRDPEALATALHDRAVTVWQAVPSMIGSMLDGEMGQETFAVLRWLLPTGEAFPASLCSRWRTEHPGVRLLNAYGPAECADDVAYFEPGGSAAMGSIVPIGQPLPHTGLYVLGHDLRTMPVGVAGELCIAGIGVGRGYLGRPDLTAERFLPDPHSPHPGTRLYRSGDLARWREDGVLEFLGRIDHQVKIRGHRIELGEIENRLLQHPTVGEAVVTVWGEGAGAQLVAHVTAHGAEWVDPQALRAQLHKALPEYCVPHRIVLLEAMPRTPNGKVDRKALPRPDADPATSRVAPRNPTEVVLAGIWCEVLGITASGVLDHFHDLGGHSLAAMQVISRVRRGFEVEVTLQEFFLEPTIEHLALVVEEKLIEKILETAPPARMA